ncbi:MAG: hypothetical protein R3290_05450 [Acidimicrobiia bacterium]|nr:hypothetical protein [Acidimicrobiia bacterium]
MTRSLTVLVLVAALASGCDPGARVPSTLLTLEDIHAAPVAPAALRSAPEGAEAVGPDPDPRGPCGASVPPFPVADAAVAVFERPDVTVVHAVADGAPGLVDAVRSDLAPGCASFTKASVAGDQETELVGSLDPGPSAAVGYVWRTVVGDAPPAFVAHVLIEGRDGAVAGVWVFADTMPVRPFVTALAVRADELLDASP